MQRRHIWADPPVPTADIEPPGQVSHQSAGAGWGGGLVTSASNFTGAQLAACAIKGITKRHRGREAPGSKLCVITGKLCLFILAQSAAFKSLRLNLGCGLESEKEREKKQSLRCTPQPHPHPPHHHHRHDSRLTLVFPLPWTTTGRES